MPCHSDIGFSRLDGGLPSAKERPQRLVCRRREWSRQRESHRAFALFHPDLPRFSMEYAAEKVQCLLDPSIKVGDFGMGIVRFELHQCPAGVSIDDADGVGVLDQLQKFGGSRSDRCGDSDSHVANLGTKVLVKVGFLRIPSPRPYRRTSPSRLVHLRSLSAQRFRRRYRPRRRRLSLWPLP